MKALYIAAGSARLEGLKFVMEDMTNSTLE